MEAPSLAVRLPLPPPRLSPNARTHWRPKARATRSYRTAAAFYARDAMATAGIRGGWTDAEVQAQFFFPTSHRRDADNLLASLKAAFDGLADAGVVTNDRNLIHLPVMQSKDRDDPRVVLRITPRRTDARP